MRYLVDELMFPLILAVLLGAVIGYLACSPRLPIHRQNWARGLFAAIAIGTAATWFRLVNGMAALWLETALLISGAFLIGAVLLCLLKALFGRDEVTVPATAAATLSSARQAEREVPPPAPAPNPAAAPAAFVDAVTTVPILPDAPPPAEPPAAPALPDEKNHEGTRPAGLAAPRDGKADDLKRIRGIGRQNEGRLHGLGIWHFDQIAKWSPEERLWVGSYLAFPGRIDREQWVEQAKILVSGAETDFSKRVARGEVATSADDGTLGQGNVEAPEKQR